MNGLLQTHGEIPAPPSTRTGLLSIQHCALTQGAMPSLKVWTPRESSRLALYRQKQLQQFKFFLTAYAGKLFPSQGSAMLPPGMDDTEYRPT